MRVTETLLARGRSLVKKRTPISELPELPGPAALQVMQDERGLILVDVVRGKTTPPYIAMFPFPSYGDARQAESELKTALNFYLHHSGNYNLPASEAINYAEMVCLQSNSRLTEVTA